MNNEELILRVENNSTFVEGKMSSEIYDKFKRELGYLPENSFWMVRNNAEKAKEHEKWKKEWDGNISAVCWNKGSCHCHIKKSGLHFQTGLLSKAATFLKSHNIPFRRIDNRNKTDKTDKYSMSDEFEFRDYQQDIINKVVGTKQTRGIDRGILKLATGAGKTALASGIVAQMGVSPTIMYVPSVDLLRQAKDELERFVKHNNLGIKVGMIGGGKKDIKDINVMTIQTAVRSLGGVWVKFDDEDNAKDETNIDDIKSDVRDLIRESKLMLCDEVQHWAAETCQIISDASLSCQYRYGLSVFPDSFVELRGGCFGDGMSCSIENAWDFAANIGQYRYHMSYGYDFLETPEDVESRGWNGFNFAWKPVKRFIRHINNKKSYSIRFAGKEEVKMTEDHSIFRIKEKNIIEECKPNELNKNDILLIDDGNDFNRSVKQLKAIDILSLNPRKMRVAVDLSDVKASQLGISGIRLSHLKNRGKIAKKYGGSLYLKDYLKYRNILPDAKWIYVEGANSTGISADLTIEDMAYLIGFYIGDGWTDGTRVNFAVEKSIKKDFLNHINNIRKIAINPKIRDMKKGSVEVRCACRPLVDFIDFYFGGKKCYEKDIPNEILFGKENIKREILEGLIASDGSRIRSREDEKRNRKPCSFTTTSLILKNNFCLLLRSLDTPYTISKREPKLGGIIDGRQIEGKHVSYQILFSDNALNSKNEGRKGKIKNTKINCIEKKVLGVDQIRHTDYVYDFEMDGHPSFVANGVLVHNSATPYRDKGDDILIEGCFGRTIADISASFLIKKGHLIKPTIYFFKVNNMRGLRKSAYANIYKQAIVENSFRNQKIVEMANRFLTGGRKVLILVKQIKHGKLLEELIPESAFIHGSTGKKKREAHLDKMREGGPQVTIASVIFDEGIDVRPLDTLILGGGGKSPTRALQRIGRILRPFEDKKDAIAVDFMDNCKYMLSHSKKRLNIYKTEDEFDIIGD